jgi:hypothetical protein
VAAYSVGGGDLDDGGAQPLIADSRQERADSREQTEDKRQQTADSGSRQQGADRRQQTADSRHHIVDLDWGAREWSTGGPTPFT